MQKLTAQNLGPCIKLNQKCMVKSSGWPHQNVSIFFFLLISGGQETWRKILTLPNILKEFNPSLMGYSLGESFAHYEDAWLNVAEPIAVSQDLLWQAQLLHVRLKSYPKFNITEHWKVSNLLQTCYFIIFNFSLNPIDYIRENTLTCFVYIQFYTYFTIPLSYRFI